VSDLYPLLVEPAQLAAVFKTAPALIGLDRDGTLSSLTELSADTFVAVVSARSLQQLEIDFGDVKKIILAGNYGMEIKYPGGVALIAEGVRENRAQMRAAVQRITALSAPIANCIVEDHGLSACLHFKITPADHLEQVHQLADKIKTDPAFDQIWVRRQPTSYEFLPAISHGKGDALRAIENTLLGSEHKRPVFFAGDSEGDESAFAWVNTRAGVSVKIGALSLEKSWAQFQLPSPNHLRQSLSLMQSRFSGCRKR